MCVGGVNIWCEKCNFSLKSEMLGEKQETTLDPFLSRFTLLDESETSEFLIVFGRAAIKMKSRTRMERVFDFKISSSTGSLHLPAPTVERCVCV